MNANTDIISIHLLNEICNDIRGLKSLTNQAFRQKLQNFTAPPDHLQEARQAGLQEGLELALEVLTSRVTHETSKQLPTPDAHTARTYTELKIAEAEYNLRAHGAAAPLASAAYSAYAQAHRRLAQARDAHARHAATHIQLASGDHSPASV